MPSDLSSKLFKTLRSHINSGLYPPGMAIPSENKIAADFNISRNTVRKALSQLCNEQLIFRKPGIGAFVTEPGAPKPAERFRIGMVHFDNLGSSHFMSVIHNGSAVTCEELGNDLILLPREKFSVNNFSSCDGLLLPQYDDFEQLTELAARLPVAILNRIIDIPALSYFAVNYTAECFRVVNRMLMNGVRRILYVDKLHAPRNSYVRLSRRRGFLQAFNENGLEFSSEFDAPPLSEIKIKGLSRLIVELEPEVVFVSSEHLLSLVFPAMIIAKNHNGKQPGMFSFDDAGFLSLAADIPLAYGQMPLRQMSEDAISYLNDVIRKKIPLKALKRTYPLSVISVNFPFLV
jgi:DNA-binding LacI/PurR family transcriptional regulator